MNLTTERRKKQMSILKESVLYLSITMYINGISTMASSYIKHEDTFNQWQESTITN